VKRLRLIGQVAVELVMCLVFLAFSPVILIVGEPVNRYVMRHLRGKSQLVGVAIVRRSGQLDRAVTSVRLTALSSLLLVSIRNPVWIALTAPGRWVWDRFSTPPSPRGRVVGP
jgi:hypothetical protein